MKFRPRAFSGPVVPVWPVIGLWLMWRIVVGHMEGGAEKRPSP